MSLLGAYSCAPSPPHVFFSVMQSLQTLDLLCSARNGQDRRVSALQILSQQGPLPLTLKGRRLNSFLALVPALR